MSNTVHSTSATKQQQPVSRFEEASPQEHTSNGPLHVWNDRLGSLHGFPVASLWVPEGVSASADTLVAYSTHMPPEVIFVEPSGGGTRLLTSAAATKFLQCVATLPGGAVTTSDAEHLEAGAKVYDAHVTMPPLSPVVPPLPDAAAAAASRPSPATAIPALL